MITVWLRIDGKPAAYTVDTKSWEVARYTVGTKGIPGASKPVLAVIEGGKR